MAGIAICTKSICRCPRIRCLGQSGLNNFNTNCWFFPLFSQQHRHLWPSHSELKLREVRQYHQWLDECCVSVSRQNRHGIGMAVAEDHIITFDHRINSYHDRNFGCSIAEFVIGILVQKPLKRFRASMILEMLVLSKERRLRLQLMLVPQLLAQDTRF